MSDVTLHHEASGGNVVVPAELVIQSLADQVKALQEVIGRLLYQSGPITPETPCRCGATDPAHYCEYQVTAKKDALALLPSATVLGVA